MEDFKHSLCVITQVSVITHQALGMVDRNSSSSVSGRSHLRFACPAFKAIFLPYRWPVSASGDGFGCLIIDFPFAVDVLS